MVGEERTTEQRRGEEEEGTRGRGGQGRRQRRGHPNLHRTDVASALQTIIIHLIPVLALSPFIFYLNRTTQLHTFTSQNENSPR